MRRWAILLVLATGPAMAAPFDDTRRTRTIAAAGDCQPFVTFMAFDARPAARTRAPRIQPQRPRVEPAPVRRQRCYRLAAT